MSELCVKETSFENSDHSRMSSRMEAVGWRQVQPEARVSPRATAAEASDPSTAPAPAHHVSRLDSFAQHTTGHTTGHTIDQERDRLERPSIVTQGPVHYYAAATNLQQHDIQRALVSPHTPSIDSWRTLPVNDPRCIKASPQHRASLPSSE